MQHCVQTTGTIILPKSEMNIDQSNTPANETVPFVSLPPSMDKANGSILGLASMTTSEELPDSQDKAFSSGFTHAVPQLRASLLVQICIIGRNARVGGRGESDFPRRRDLILGGLPPLAIFASRGPSISRYK